MGVARVTVREDGIVEIGCAGGGADGEAGTVEDALQVLANLDWVAFAEAVAGGDAGKARACDASFETDEGSRLMEAILALDDVELLKAAPDSLEGFLWIAEQRRAIVYEEAEVERDGRWGLTAAAPEAYPIILTGRTYPQPVEGPLAATPSSEQLAYTALRLIVEQIGVIPAALDIAGEMSMVELDGIAREVLAISSLGSKQPIGREDEERLGSAAGRVSQSIVKYLELQAAGKNPPTPEPWPFFQRNLLAEDKASAEWAVAFLRSIARESGRIGEASDLLHSASGRETTAIQKQVVERHRTALPWLEYEVRDTTELLFSLVAACERRTALKRAGGRLAVCRRCGSVFISHGERLCDKPYSPWPEVGFREGCRKDAVCKEADEFEQAIWQQDAEAWKKARSKDFANRGQKMTRKISKAYEKLVDAGFDASLWPEKKTAAWAKKHAFRSAMRAYLNELEESYLEHVLILGEHIKDWHDMHFDDREEKKHELIETKDRSPFYKIVFDPYAADCEDYDDLNALWESRWEVQDESGEMNNSPYRDRNFRIVPVAFEWPEARFDEDYEGFLKELVRKASEAAKSVKASLGTELWKYRNWHLRGNTNISITGSLGAGKSTVCKLLATRGWKVVSTGEIFRQIADERGLSVLELNERLTDYPSVDAALDERIERLNRTLDRCVFDSRMAWHFAKGSLRVFLSCSEEVAAKRVLKDARVSEEYSTAGESIAALRARQKAEKERFEYLYGVDYLDTSNYDLVIDTSNRTPKEIADMVEEAVKW